MTKVHEDGDSYCRDCGWAEGAGHADSCEIAAELEVPVGEEE